MILRQNAYSIFIIFFTQVLFILNSSAESHIARGDYYYRMFDNVSAQNEYEKAYYESSKSFNALICLIRIHNDNGRIKLYKNSAAETEYKKAVFYADSLLFYYPDSAVSHFWYALARGSLIPFVSIREKITIGKEVRFHLRKSLEYDSSFAYSYIILSIFEREAAQLSWFERAIVRLVFGEEVSGSLIEAERCLNIALKYSPSNVFAYYELFWTYKAMGNRPKAIFALQKTLKCNPESLREKYQQEEARKYLIELYPSIPDN